MWLLELEADRLRNLKEVSLGLSSKMTALVGRNGQGKTSLLEAVYLLSTGRSFQTRRNEDLIHWDGGPLRVSGTVEGRLGKQNLGLVLEGGERKLLINQATVELDQFLGRLDVIDLTAERMKVLRGEPQHRRRFLDRGLVGEALLLGPRTALLQLVRAREVKTWEQGMPRPLLLELHPDSDFSDLTYLVRQAFHFSFMSWKSFFPSNEPVTILYSGLIAKLLGNLRAVPGWDGSALTQMHDRRAMWFL